MSHPLPSFSAASHACRTAWQNPAHTSFELPPVNVNKVLRDRYRRRRPKGSHSRNLPSFLRMAD
jgi:hypothetical protein